jgi:hypothetical protein
MADQCRKRLNYFLFLFLWLAAIFSLDVIGAGVSLAPELFPSDPAGAFVSVPSGLRLEPFLLP